MTQQCVQSKGWGGRQLRCWTWLGIGLQISSWNCTAWIGDDGLQISSESLPRGAGWFWNAWAKSRVVRGDGHKAEWGFLWMNLPCRRREYWGLELGCYGCCTRLELEVVIRAAHCNRTLQYTGDMVQVFVPYREGSGEMVYGTATVQLRNHRNRTAMAVCSHIRFMAP